MPDPLADVLVERDGVSEPAAPGMGRGGEETVVGRMPAIDLRMRYAAEYGEIIPVLLQQLEVGGEGVSLAFFLGEEVLGQQAEVVADAEHPAGLPSRDGCGRGFGGASEDRGHGVQQGQGEGNTRATEELAPRERATGGYEGAVHANQAHLLRKSSLCTSSSMRVRIPYWRVLARSSSPSMCLRSAKLTGAPVA